MGHLEASATLPQRNSAVGKAAPQRPRAGYGSFEGLSESFVLHR